MEPKLQQAIVATRAGRVDVAQQLLIQLINENPEEPNAWFLLSHLVNSPERQTRYLNKALQIDPDHELAQKRLAELPESPVPAPVIQEKILDGRDKKRDSEGEFEEVKITPSTPPIKEASDSFLIEAEPIPQTQDWLDDFEQVRAEEENKELAVDQEWIKSAGTPKRESSTPSDQNEANQATISTTQRSKGDTWLIRVLLLMVLIAFIVLGFLIILILI